MKIIISHDVDHLQSSDHIFRDLIIEKFWIRAFLHLTQRKISGRTFVNRIKYPFLKRYERIQEVMETDRANGIPSVFFFGVERGLGMSYGKRKVKRYISQVDKAGFDIGIHGIAYEEFEQMKKEHDAFEEIAGISSFGIRMHYVRYVPDTFKKLADIGYIYDTTEFDKSGKKFRKPYKVGNMWEFPLYIMDGYILKNKSLDQGIIATQRAIKQAEKEGVPYCTILFHDYLYNKACFPMEYNWYKWLIKYLTQNHYEFISYNNAIKELEETYSDGF